MVPSQMVGGMVQSSSSSGIFFQGDGQYQVAGSSQLSSNIGNSLHSLPGRARASMAPLSGDVSNAVLNSVASSGPSVGASSLVTDANSGLSGGGPHLQRSASFNTDSYMRLPASPLSFTSNNISISGSSVIDGSSVAQQSSNKDPCAHVQPSQHHQGASSATSLPTSRMGQLQLPSGPRVANSLIQDPTTISKLQKRPRLDIKQEDIVQQQVLQQLLQRQDPIALQNPNPQLQALIQQQRFRQQQQREQLLQSMPPMQRVQLLQQQQQQQLRQQLLQQGVQSASGVKRPYDGGVCSRRLMQYLYHQRQRPTDNTIAYWRKFVAEYYSPRAKKRWCLSLYDNVGHHSLGVFPQAAMDAWHCDICGSKSGRGFEATFEVLPRLNEIKFGSGIIDELLFLDLPRECRFPSGMMMLEYAKAVSESVYEQLRVVREGQLRIIFTPDLKILSWEFCARRHEELLPRRLVAPQVNTLLQVAQKCQSTISESGPDGVSQTDLQANSVMVITAGRQLARSLELQSLNDLGFSKRYVRCLQIAEVVNSMKDLMDSCTEQKLGPIEGLKNFPRHTSTPKDQMQEMEQVSGPQGLPTDHCTLNKLISLHPGLNGSISNNNQHLISGRGSMAGSAQAALALTTYQNLLMRQNSMNSTHNNNNNINNNYNNTSLQQEVSSPYSSYSHQTPTTPGRPSAALPAQVNEFSQRQQNQSMPSQGSQALQQQMIQQLLQDMSNKNNGTVISQQQSVSVQNQCGNISTRDSVGFRSSSPARNPLSRNTSLKGASNGESQTTVANVGYNQKALDVTQDLDLADELVEDVAQEFIDNGFFGGDLDDNDNDMNFSWKA
ncbi:putative transcriptional regulator slk2 [Orobanche gracilis]